MKHPKKDIIFIEIAYYLAVALLIGIVLIGIVLLFIFISAWK